MTCDRCHNQNDQRGWETKRLVSTADPKKFFGRIARYENVCTTCYVFLRDNREDLFAERPENWTPVERDGYEIPGIPGVKIHGSKVLQGGAKAAGHQVGVTETSPDDASHAPAPAPPKPEIPKTGAPDTAPAAGPTPVSRKSRVRGPYKKRELAPMNGPGKTGEEKVDLKAESNILTIPPEVDVSPEARYIITLRDEYATAVKELEYKRSMLAADLTAVERELLKANGKLEVMEEILERIQKEAEAAA